MKIRKAMLAIAAMLALMLALAATTQAVPSGDSTSAKKGCSITLQKPDGSPGQGVVYDDGYSFSVKDKATGKVHTYTCKDGKWEETVEKKVGRLRLDRSAYEGSFTIQPSGSGLLKGKEAPRGGKIPSQQPPAAAQRR